MDQERRTVLGTPQPKLTAVLSSSPALDVPLSTQRPGQPQLLRALDPRD